MTNVVDEYWKQMVTVALLGTDRREPPAPPTGGLADIAADDPQPRTVNVSVMPQLSEAAPC